MEFKQNLFETSQDAVSGALAEGWRFPEGLAAVDAAPNEQLQKSEGWLAVRTLSGFFAVLVALGLGLNAIITYGLWHVETGQYGVSNRLMRGRINTRVVINGSSRALSGFDPSIIQGTTGLSAYNIGRNGSQTDMQLAVLNAYLEHNQKPEIVIQSLDVFSFEKTREVYNPAQYVPYLSDDALWKPLRRINPSIWKSRYVPLYGYVVDDMSMSWILGLRALVGWSPREDYFLGFNPRTLRWTDEFKNFKASNPNGVSWPVDDEGRESLEELIRVCRDKRIQLIFVYPPEYVGIQNLSNNRAEVFAYFNELSSKYNVPFWDYSSWRHAADTEFFQNSQHLNERGAEVFSMDLAAQLKQFRETKPLSNSKL